MTTQKMLSFLRKGVTEYKLIKDGDRIAVGVSGGKDSVTLLKLLAEYSRFSPEKFTLVAISVDLNFNKTATDFAPIKKLCDYYGIEYHVVNTDIGEIVFDVRKETNPCALCSKMRKGALFDKAVELKCNKVALGHHADDLIDTFALSLFFEGRLSTFSPKCFLDRTGLVQIRPMIMIKESDIVGYSKTLPIVKNPCPIDKHTKREYVKDALKNLSKDVPNLRDMVYSALIHPERYNLFDKFLKDCDEIE